MMRYRLICINNMLDDMGLMLTWLDTPIAFKPNSANGQKVCFGKPCEGSSRSCG